MATIIFVRHGQSEVNVRYLLSEDENINPLTATGVSQAEATASELKQLSKPAVIFTSPVLRARQTAEIIAKEFGAEPRVDRRLRERGNGELNNRQFGSEKELYGVIMTEIKSNYPHGFESLESEKTRMGEFVQNVPSGVVIAVSHKGPITAALALFDTVYDDDAIPRDANWIVSGSMTIVNTSQKKILAIGSDKLPAELKQ
ncbi:MAG: histidine phosphatase family protein [Candidatus Micrarchaeota archaeon]|nr:histidine phosphatase family protein [Candidatus Micrarchaeota archaeon]